VCGCYRLRLEALIDATVRLAGRVVGARPGRKVLTLVHAMWPAGSGPGRLVIDRRGREPASLASASLPEYGVRVGSALIERC